MSDVVQRPNPVPVQDHPDNQDPRTDYTLDPWGRKVSNKTGKPLTEAELKALEEDDDPSKDGSVAARKPPGRKPG